jgi:hypothetical protein
MGKLGLESEDKDGMSRHYADKATGAVDTHSRKGGSLLQTR